MKAKLLLSVLIVSLLQFTRGHDYLKEPPSFLKPCNAHGSDFSACFSNTLQKVFTEWKDGIPGLTAVGPFDPMHIKKLKVTISVPNLANLHVEMKNIIVQGLSQIQVVRTAFNPKDYSFKVLIKMPKMRLDSDYKLKGSILGLNLDGHGKGFGELYDLDFFVSAKASLKKIGDEHFIMVSSVSSDIKNLSGLKVYFHDLFGDNKDLEKTTNQLFNDNWREFYDIMRPTAVEVVNSIIMDRFQKIFQYVPVRFFIADLV